MNTQAIWPARRGERGDGGLVTIIIVVLLVVVLLVVLGIIR